MKPESIALKKAMWQVPALIGLAGLIAVGVNLFRTQRIPFVGDWSQEKRFPDNKGESLTITLEQAGDLFERDAALFVDARPRDQYARGHIRGALSLPWQDLDNYFMEIVDRLDTDKTIVTYCDGENCNLSHGLALFLKDSGFNDTRVLVNGWTLWRKAGLPVAVGE